MGIIKTAKLLYEYIRYDDDGNPCGSSKALEDINIDIEPGSFVAILGHNGSGKSTLAKHFNALFLPKEGTVWVDAKETAKEENLWDIRQTTGMVFQNPDNQIVGNIVEEDVGFGPENMGVPTEEIWKRVDRAIENVGMQAYRLKSPNMLSGGQKQRVAIAGVMAMKPKCIVLDEPTAMLDPNGRMEVIRTLHELNKAEGITIVLITHYMEETIDADRLIVMKKGQVVMDGTPRTIFSKVEELYECGLCVPQVTELTHELRKKGVPLPEGIISIEEFADEYVKVVKSGSYIPKLQRRNVAEQKITKAQEATEEQKITKVQEITAEQKIIDANGSAADFDKKFLSQDPERVEKRDVILETKDLTFSYQAGTIQETHALLNVNLSIHPGEFIGLAGHTGSGKSTLIQHLNGLVKPTGGSVYFKGEDIHEKNYPMRALRQRVGLVFQYPEHQLFEETVLKDVEFGPKNLGMSKEQARECAIEALRLVKLDEKYYEGSPFDLSGGQKRRVAIAGVLAMNPEVLILDEPTAGLDPVGRDEILNAVSSLRDERGISIILVSHSMEDISRYADRIIVMSKGEKIFDDTPRNVFTQEMNRLEEIGLAAPQIAYIMKEIKNRGVNVDESCITICEAVHCLS